MYRLAIILVISLPLVFTYGCSREALGGAALGAGAAGAAYEYTNKDALDDLDREYERGKISKEEYLKRKKEIQDRSLLY